MYSNLHGIHCICLCVCLCLCRSGWTALWREECCTRQWLWWRIAAPSSGTWPSPWTGTLFMSCLTIRWGNALISLLLSGETLSSGVMSWVAEPSFSWRPVGSSPCDRECLACWHVLEWDTVRVAWNLKSKVLLDMKRYCIAWAYVLPSGQWKLYWTNRRKIIFTLALRHKTNKQLLFLKWFIWIEFIRILQKEMFGFGLHRYQHYC